MLMMELGIMHLSISVTNARQQDDVIMRVTEIEEESKRYREVLLKMKSTIDADSRGRSNLIPLLSGANMMYQNCQY